jgi:hypothetical protein
LFISLLLSKVVCCIVHISTLFHPLTSQIYSGLLAGVGKKDRAQIRMGASEIYGTSRMIIFLAMQMTYFLCRLFSWILTEYVPMEKRENLVIGCNQLETVALDLYGKFS